MNELKDKLAALIGTPYGDPRFAPADCWGFVRYCYRLAGFDLPESLWQARHFGFEVTNGSRKFLDMLYFRDALLNKRHVALMFDRLYCLQSSETTNGVALIRLGRPGLTESIQAIFRLYDLKDSR